jgi:SAM-dependent methyltransferase
MTSDATVRPKVDVTPPRGARLNLGCGHNAVDGWDNYDRSPMMIMRKLPLLRTVLLKAKVLHAEHMNLWPESIIRRDLSKPLPYADGTAEAVYSSHMLEHLYLDDARALLAECFRVLRPGGIIRLAVPDGEMWARDLIAAGDDPGGVAGLKFQEMLRAHPNSKPMGRRKVAFVAGSNWHKWQPTRGLVRQMFADTGFVDFKEMTFRVGESPDLQQTELREDSMFFEAKKP